MSERRELLSGVLRRINEFEQRGFLSFLVSGTPLSSFFERFNKYSNLRGGLETSVREMETLSDRIIMSNEELSEKKTAQGLIKKQQQADANQVTTRRKQKERVLETQIAREDETKDQISIYEARSAEIRNRLFDLSGTGAIPFGQALEYAEQVERAFSVRPAFLLGVINYESKLGKQVGESSYLTEAHPLRDLPVFPYIAKLLGFSDPNKLPVSAAPQNGYGGAMGPSQFLPSTWVEYGGLVNTKTGTYWKKNQIILGTAVLGIGSSGNDVKRLHKFLNKHGFSDGLSGSAYTQETASAVRKFQNAYGSKVFTLRPSNILPGKVDKNTRNAVNQLEFYSGPWQYDASKDKIRAVAKNHRPSNPWNPRDAFFASGMYLKRLGADKDECKAARRYHAGGYWQSATALRYCQGVMSNAALFQRDIDYLNKE